MVAAIEAFVLGMIRHSKQQKIAQAELDTVVGRERLPTLADRERLPYFEALYLEVLRFYTFGPLGEYAYTMSLQSSFLVLRSCIVIVSRASACCA